MNGQTAKRVQNTPFCLFPPLFPEVDVDRLEQIIYDAIEEVIDVDRATLSPHRRFDSFGLSSLEFIIVLFEIEDALDISIPNDDRAQFTTIEEGIRYLQKRQAAPTAP